jgi:hypothetical protein
MHFMDPLPPLPKQVARAEPQLVAPPRQPGRSERRLRAQLEPGERLITWTRGWVSRDGRMHTLFAARTLDFAVISDRRLYFFSTGFFTRRPRRRVYSSDFDHLQVSSTGTNRGHRLRIVSPLHQPILFENRNTEHNVAFALELVMRTRSPMTP